MSFKEKTLAEKIEVMDAFSRGKPIESCPLPMFEDYVYSDNTNPSWNWNNYDYRVKERWLDLAYPTKDVLSEEAFANAKSRADIKCFVDELETAIKKYVWVRKNSKVIDDKCITLAGLGAAISDLGVETDL